DAKITRQAERAFGKERQCNGSQYSQCMGCGVATRVSIWIDGHSGRFTGFFQKFDGTSYHLLFIPMNSLETRSNPSLCIEEVCFDFVPVDQRLDEVNAELEMIAQ